MADSINIRELNERIESKSTFITHLTTGMNQTIVGQKHLIESLLIGLLSDGHVLLDTVVGAQKQYRIGRNLIRCGAITAGAGLASALTGVVILAANSEDRLVYYDDVQYPGHVQYRERVYDDDDEFAYATGAIFLVGGYVAMLTGAALLEVGIPLKIIGQSRLNWVENDYNEYSRNVSLHVGAAPHGVGLTLRF